MIFIGVGGNLATERHGSPRRTCVAALAALNRSKILVSRISGWYHSAPVPISDQPWYANAVAEIDTDLQPDELLHVMHVVEEDFGRLRTPGLRNQARTVDLDLLDYRGEVRDSRDHGIVLPHPRMHERTFVLLPLNELAPNWVHPVTERTIADLIVDLPADQSIEKMKCDTADRDDV